MTEKNKIHFVGSIGLENAEQVFRALAEQVGDKANRYPDGETGVRTTWLLWQIEMFMKNPNLMPEPADAGRMLNGIPIPPRCRVAPGKTETDLSFDNIGYADAALESYSVFKKLKDEGVVPAGTRLQVSLPTPRAVVEHFVLPEELGRIEPVYTRAMANEIARMVDGIPHDELAIQWDVCTELLAHDGGWPTDLDDPLKHTVDALKELNGNIPEDVEVGIHLCYGDPGHKHIIEPKDLTSSVLFANTLVKESPRRMDFMHMPVPKDRSDEEYFAPLKDLDMGDCELSLGLVHLTDGKDGTSARMTIADNFVSGYSVSTECGFGRRPAETIPDLLKIHAAVV